MGFGWIESLTQYVSHVRGVTLLTDASTVSSSDRRAKKQ